MICNVFLIQLTLLSHFNPAARRSILAASSAAAPAAAGKY